MRYILAYFALMLGLSGLGMLIAGAAIGFFLILAAAALIYWLIRMERERRRGQRFGEYGPAIDGYEKHFAAASRALEAKLPQDALDNPALLELLSGEDADRADAIRAEYARLRQRFHEWQEDFARLHEQTQTGAIGLPGPFADHYARLDRELTELLDEVERLEERAAEAKGFGDNPLEEVARGALKLEQATSVCNGVFGADVPAEVGAQLAEGNEKLTQARAQLERGAERPLVAARLAREAYALADGVSRRVQELADKPREVSAQRTELEVMHRRLVDEVAVAQAKLKLAVEHYASACLQPIGGLDASAEQALEHASSLIESASTPADAFRLDEAHESLNRAAELTGRIVSHLAALEQAALQAPSLVEDAELAGDRAWASATVSSGAEGGAGLIVTRARELTTEARTELGVARPDWFRVVSLARRALEMVGELAPAPVREPQHETPPATEAHRGVEDARQSAESALTEVGPLVKSLEERAGAENMASICFERGEFAYSKGLALQKQLAGAEDPAAVAIAAVDSFRLAVEAAAAAREHAELLHGPRGGPSPAPRWRFGGALGSD